MRKKIFVIGMALFMCLPLFCGCECKHRVYKTYGDFLYTVVYPDENDTSISEETDRVAFIRIVGLSEMGEQKEVVVVPEYIDDLRVEVLGTIGKNWGIAFSSEKLKKVIIPFNVPLAKWIFSGAKQIEKIIILVNDASLVNDEYESLLPFPDRYKYFLTGKNYNPNESSTNKYDIYYFANVSFMYNYENAKNDGYYWIDDYDYGEKIAYIPENPERDGYAFDGWYKEPECMNRWDFDADTLPEVKYTDDEEEIYQETKLYAKWILI